MITPQPAATVTPTPSLCRSPISRVCACVPSSLTDDALPRPLPRPLNQSQLLIGRTASNVESRKSKGFVRSFGRSFGLSVRSLVVVGRSVGWSSAFGIHHLPNPRTKRREGKGGKGREGNANNNARTHGTRMAACHGCVVGGLVKK